MSRTCTASTRGTEIAVKYVLDMRHYFSSEEDHDGALMRLHAELEAIALALRMLRQYEAGSPVDDLIEELQEGGS